MNNKSLSLPLHLLVTLTVLGEQASIALPPPEDTPEEILRTEIILDARSPLDGQPLTAAEYAELEAQLQQSAFPPEVNSDIQHLVFLLQIRKLLKTLIPVL